MSDKIIKYIMDRKMLEAPKFSLRKMLKYCDMDIYAELCVGRTIDEIGADNVDITFDFVNVDILLTYKGIKKCETVLLSYCNIEQMAKMLELIKLEEEQVINLNNLLWLLQGKSVKELVEMLKESEANGGQYICDKIRAELKSRSVWNRVRLCLTEYCCDVIARVKYRKIFKMISNVVKKYRNDTAYQAHLELKDRPVIIHNNYIKYRDISPRKRSKDELKKYVFYGILDLVNWKSKYTVRNKECFEIEAKYKAMQDIITAAAELTPRDFINMFPIDKEYYGEKYGEKDYFFTMKELRSFPMDKKIGDMIIPFLDIYYSKPVFLFWVKYVSCIDDYSLYCGFSEPSDEYYSNMRAYWKQAAYA